jgi:4-amino-4-deoxy-L-arabinose transferase-like glycosyltransferase
MSTRTKLGILVLFALVATIVLNEINLSFLGNEYPYKQGLITTADEYSYFSPAKQLLKTGEWNVNSTGEKAYIRTPGYGIIYFLALAIGGSHAFFVLKCIQLLLFTGSIVLFFRLLRFFVDEKFSLIATAIYALLPCFSGFTYYTLSESVLPFFVLVWLYSVFVKSEKNQWLMLLFSTVALVMIRPQLIVFPLVLLLYYTIKRDKLVFALLLGLLPFVSWQVRTMSILGHWPDLHPIYSTKNNSLYRPPHQEMTDLFRIWEYRGEVFHGNMGVLSSDTTKEARNNVLETIPMEYRKDVTPVLQDFQQLRHFQQSIYAGKSIHGFLPGEKELVQKIQKARKHLQAEHPFDYYLKTPCLSAKRLIGTSMMNLYLFQADWSKTWIVLLLKIVCFVLIFGGLCATIVALLWGQNDLLKVCALALLLSLFYLVFFQRMNEERYLYPYLPVMLLFLVAVVGKWKERLKQFQP